MGTEQLRTSRLTQRVEVTGPPDGRPVLLIHGNCSSAAYWAPLVRALPAGLRVVAPDLRGFGGTEPAPVDATRGLRDYADDVAQLLEEPRLFPAGARPFVVGHSMGGGIAMQLAIDHPDRVAGLFLAAPVSPYGFGATRDADGTPTTADFAGSGGGVVNPEFPRRLAAGDRSADDPASPRSVLRSTYVADPATLGADEELLLDSVLSTVVGPDHYPGDATPSENWPLAAPGTRGVLNALSPKYLNLTGLVDIEPKPPVVWIHGDCDAVISDASLYDVANLGKQGLVPGWPGDEVAPPQPMVGQVRALLERHAAAGGRYTEILLDGCGHSPHIERPDEFRAALLELVGAGRL